MEVERNELQEEHLEENQPVDQEKLQGKQSVDQEKLQEENQPVDQEKLLEGQEEKLLEGLEKLLEGQEGLQEKDNLFYTNGQYNFDLCFPFLSLFLCILFTERTQSVWNPRGHTRRHP